MLTNPNSSSAWLILFFIVICSEVFADEKERLHDLPDVLLVERSSKKSEGNEHGTVRLFFRNGQVEFPNNEDPKERNTGKTCQAVDCLSSIPANVVKTFVPPLVIDSLYCQNRFQFSAVMEDLKERGEYILVPTKKNARKIEECDSRFIHSNSLVGLKESKLEITSTALLPKEAIRTARIALLEEFDLSEKNLREEYGERDILNDLSLKMLSTQRQLLANLPLLPIDVYKIKGEETNSHFLLSGVIEARRAKELPAYVVFSVLVMLTPGGWVAIGPATRLGEVNEEFLLDSVHKYQGTKIDGMKITVAPFSDFGKTKVFSHLVMGDIEIYRGPEFRKIKNKNQPWQHQRDIARYYLKSRLKVTEFALK
jgi:hypothetical protein